MKHLYFLLFFSISAFSKEVRYELVAKKSSVNLSGKADINFALTINGTIPAPILEFTEGDDAIITVKNEVPNEELSIHWHGILLPPEMDGVPYVNTPPIYSGKSYTFKFKVRQHGTYWYHSHTSAQEQKGLYGAIVIHPKNKTIDYDKDVVLVLSDWSDEDANQILKNLRKDGDYYLYKKKSIRSWFGAIKEKSLGSYLKNEWTRMGGMDLSDVGYDAFLINGKKESQALVAHPGEKIRLRIINAGASSYFYVSLANLPMKVISADGVDIEPIVVNEILFGMAETYDVLFEIPEHKNFELRATAQDITGYASAWIGMGEKVKAKNKVMPNKYMSMDHANHSSGNHSGDTHTANEHSVHNQPPSNEHASHSKSKTSRENKNEHETHALMDQSKHSEHLGKATDLKTSIDILTVDNLKAKNPTTLPKSPIYEVKLVLDGDMERYIWHLNGKAIHEDKTLIVHPNQIVRYTFVNNTMMHHPMHLHGHFFRVINKHGEYSPLKHTVDVPPHMSRTIEFYTDEPGEWMLHCHNLYHMKTGMARVVKYSSFNPSKEISNWQPLDPHLHDHWYFYGKAEAASNHAEGYLSFSQTWNQVEARIESANIHGKNFSFDDEWDYEGDLFYRRWMNRFFNLVAGGTSFGKEEKAIIGFGYLLPMLIKSNVFIDHEGEFRMDLEKRFQWTSTVFSDVDYTYRPNQKGEHESEIEISLMYSPAWAWSVGLMLTNDSLGGGIEVQF